MTNIVRTPSSDSFHPFCNVCRHPVEKFQLEFVTRIVPHPTLIGAQQREHTGEMIAHVECHGETCRISNRRGVVLDTAGHAWGRSFKPL